MDLITQIVIAIGLIFGGGSAVKIYETWRTKNKEDADDLIERYRKMLDDKDKDHEAQLIRVLNQYQQVKEDFAAYRDSVQKDKAVSK